MSVVLRPGSVTDAAVCGAICFEAFKAINDTHHFPPDLPSPEVATAILGKMLSHSGIYSVVAEADGKILGSNFLDERGPISGVGPITVDPAIQDKGIGRRLMVAVLERAVERRAAGIRLLQASFHNRSFCLYTSLGFDSRETISKIDGTPLNFNIPGYEVRLAQSSDVAACNDLCRRVHGHDRGGELQEGIDGGTARVVKYLGAITAYASDVAFFGHAVAENNQGLKALIGAASDFPGGGFLVPTGNSELLRWCLQRGLRLVHQMTLMSIGLYNEPDGAYLPSVTY
jgi:GNAT superfamily N-acetyltransferase